MDLPSLLSFFAFSFLLGCISTLWSFSRPEKLNSIMGIKINDNFDVPELKILKVTRMGRKITGLLNHLNLDLHHGILLFNTSRIHCKSMNFPIAVIFISKQGKVTKIQKIVLPGDVCIGPKGTAHTLELNIESNLIPLISAGSLLEFKQL